MNLGPVSKLDKRNTVSATAIILLLLVKVLLLTKLLIFDKKMLTSAKLRGSWYYKVYFLKLHMCVLTYQISSFSHNSNEF